MVLMIIYEIITAAQEIQAGCSQNIILWSENVSRFNQQEQQQ